LLQVIASPKGAAISFLLGLLRRSAPRNDTFLIAFVLIITKKKGRSYKKDRKARERKAGEKKSRFWKRIFLTGVRHELCESSGPASHLNMPEV